eukprot:5728636-Pyramimonas_sp.AAC.1
MGPLGFFHLRPSCGTANHMLRSSGSVKKASAGLVVVCHTAAAQAKADATMLRQTGSPSSTVFAWAETPA